MPSHIEWTDETWNPVTGCDRVSEGCDHCYIERQPPLRIAGRKFDEAGKMGIQLHPQRMNDSRLHREKPTKFFTCSMGDLFHPNVPDDFIARVFDVMRWKPWHTFQVLTKRPQRMEAFTYERELDDQPTLPNVWLGTSIELDKYCFRANYVRRSTAATRFLSLEPLLGPLPSLDLTDIDWCIVGGESGPSYRAMDLAWLETVAQQCDNAGVPLFVKQDSLKKSGQQGRIPSSLWERKEFPNA